MKKFLTTAVTTAFLTTSTFGFLNFAYAQESAEDDLNSCVIGKQVSNAVVGGLTGAAMGALAGALTGDGEKAATGAAIGAVAGAGTGWIKAYLTANADCLKDHPEWIPDAELVRTKDYARVKKELKYNSKKGIVGKFKKFELAKTVTTSEKAENFPIKTTFQVMTPDGAESSYKIERKLYITPKGEAETPVEGLDKYVEERTLEPGEHTDKIEIPSSYFTSEKLKGSSLRFEFSVSNGGKVLFKKDTKINVK